MTKGIALNNLYAKGQWIMVAMNYKMKQNIFINEKITDNIAAAKIYEKLIYQSFSSLN